MTLGYFLEDDEVESLGKDTDCPIGVRADVKGQVAIP